MSNWARPGVKCVCLTSRWRRCPSLSWSTWIRCKMLGLPIQGGVYTITSTQWFDGALRISLKGWGPLLFPLTYFRPLVDDQERRDIALFTPLLDPKAPRIPDDKPARTPA